MYADHCRSSSIVWNCKQKRNKNKINYKTIRMQGAKRKRLNWIELMLCSTKGIKKWSLFLDAVVPFFFLVRFCILTGANICQNIFFALHLCYGCNGLTSFTYQHFVLMNNPNNTTDARIHIYSWSGLTWINWANCLMPLSAHSHSICMRCVTK